MWKGVCYSFGTMEALQVMQDILTKAFMAIMFYMNLCHKKIDLY